jgi:hypothetical protein
MPVTSPLQEYAPMMMFAGVAIIVIVIAILNSQYEKKRTLELADFGKRMGLAMVDSSQMDAPITTSGFLSGLFSNFSGGDIMNSMFLARFEGFEPFGLGYGMRTKNLLVGTKDGTDWYIFDYYYTTGSGKSTQRHHYSIMAARVPFSFPKLTLKPENFFTKVGEHLGMQDLHFESNEFNERYYIQCDQDKVAYDILCPQVIDYMMQQPPRWWQLFSMYIVVADTQALRAETCYQVMSEVTGFVSKLPNYVHQDLGFTPKWTTAFD